jgi:hypothetical protein
MVSEYELQQIERAIRGAEQVVEQLVLVYEKLDEFAEELEQKVGVKLKPPEIEAWRLDEAFEKVQELIDDYRRDTATRNRESLLRRLAEKVSG